MKQLIILALLVTLSIVSQIEAQNAERGEVRICTEQGMYNGEQSRTSEMLQFHPINGEFDDTYIIRYYQNTPVCSRLLIDYERQAAFYQEGDQQYFLPLTNLNSTSSCMASLHPDLPFSQSENPRLQTNSQMSVLETDFEDYQLNYPTDLLLAPAYIGEFPKLADVPLLPYDGRGFSQEIALEQLPVNIFVENARFSEPTVASLINFYLEQLPGWQLAEPDLTAFADNPTLLPGDRSAYLSLFNAETDKLINVEFHINLRSNVMRVLVFIPEDPEQTSATSVIEGSSQSLATLGDFFAGWGGADVEPAAIYADGTIRSYILRRDNHYWFVDIEVIDDSFEVLYSRIVTQTSCDPDTFLPDWAGQP